MKLHLIALLLTLCWLSGCCGLGDPSEAKLTEWRTKVVGMQRDQALNYLQHEGLSENGPTAFAYHGEPKNPYPGGLRMERQTSSCLFTYRVHGARVDAYVDDSGKVVSAWSQLLEQPMASP